MTKNELLEIGFKKIPHFTVGDSLIFNIGRARQLSISCVDTPNEMMCISEMEDMHIIVLHNWDYDGELKKEKVEGLIKLLNTKQND